MVMHRSAGLTSFFLLTATLQAQTQPGDWLVASIGTTQAGLFRLTPPTGALQVLSAPPQFFPNGVLMDADNTGMLALDLFNTIHAVTPAGGLTPGLVLANVPGQMALDQDGTFVCATEWGGLVRVDLAAQTETPLWMHTREWTYGVCVDGDTGDYIVAGLYYLTDGRLTRVHRRTGVGTVLASGLGQVTRVAFDPLSGEFLVTNGDPLAPLIRVRRDGSATSMGMFVPAGASAVHIDQETGNILVAGTTALRELSPLGMQLRSVPLAAGFQAADLARYGERKVSGFGPATPGSPYSVRFAFPGRAGRTYVAMLATALRPGIPLGDGTGRVISLQPDWLFMASLGGLPGLTQGFVGTLDAQGNATGTLHIPATLAPGTRLYLSAVVLDATAPSGLVTANSWGFTVN